MAIRRIVACCLIYLTSLASAYASDQVKVGAGEVEVGVNAGAVEVAIGQPEGSLVIEGEDEKPKITRLPVEKKPEAKVSPKKTKHKVKVTSSVSYGQVLSPDTVHEIPLSTTEINRISASDEITTIKHDQKIKVDVDYEGNDAFLYYRGKHSFLAYIVTSSAVFPVRFVPSKIPATYYVLDENSVVQKAADNSLVTRKKVKGNSKETRILEMLKYAYQNHPTSEGDVQITPLDDVIKTRELDFFSFKTYYFDEDNMFVKVILVRTAQDYDQYDIMVEEKDFILPELLEYPIGIALEDTVVTKDSYVRVFLIGAKYREESIL